MPIVTFERLNATVEKIYCEPIRRKKTAAKVKQVLREMNAAGLTRTDRISPTLIAAWLKKHPDRKAVTAYSLLRSFRAVCSLCIAQGWLKADPFVFRRPASWLPELDQGDEDEPLDRHRSADEIGRLFRLLDKEAESGEWKRQRLRALVYTYAFLGLRRNEALQLHREDLDLITGTVRIRSRRGRRLKTRASKATMALPADLLPILREWVARCGSEWVFPGVTRKAPWTGGPPGYKPLDEVKAAGRRAGIDNLTILDFRHTIGTLAEQWGMGELELMRFLRHDKPSTQAWYRKKGDLDGMRATAAKVRFKVS